MGIALAVVSTLLAVMGWRGFALCRKNERLKAEVASLIQIAFDAEDKTRGTVEMAGERGLKIALQKRAIRGLEDQMLQMRTEFGEDDCIRAFKREKAEAALYRDRWDGAKQDIKELEEQVVLLKAEGKTVPVESTVCCIYGCNGEPVNDNEFCVKHQHIFADEEARKAREDKS